MSKLDVEEKRTRGIDEVKEWVHWSDGVIGGCGWGGTCEWNISELEQLITGYDRLLVFATGLND